LAIKARGRAAQKGGEGGEATLKKIGVKQLRGKRKK